jgi:hypothetical protein
MAQVLRKNPASNMASNPVGDLLSGLVVFAVILGGPVTPSAMAAGVKAVASFKDWSVHVIAGKSRKICYIHSEPKKSAGKYKTRGATYIQVTHRSKPKTANEISVTAGYAYRKGDPVDITVDGKKFVLFTEGDTAWSRDATGDKSLVAAMRSGIRMIIKGVSSRGTRTTDQYSLSGFTSAHKAISKACKVK